MPKPMSKEATHLNGLYQVLRGVYSLLQFRKDDSSKRLCTAINDWISENM